MVLIHCYGMLSRFAAAMSAKSVLTHAYRFAFSQGGKLCDKLQYAFCHSLMCGIMLFSDNEFCRTSDMGQKFTLLGIVTRAIDPSLEQAELAVLRQQAEQVAHALHQSQQLQIFLCFAQQCVTLMPRDELLQPDCCTPLLITAGM